LYHLLGAGCLLDLLKGGEVGERGGEVGARGGEVGARGGEVAANGSQTKIKFFILGCVH
jgi:hypothetical protein